MNVGPQLLDTVLAEARRHKDDLEATFDVPVLVVVADDPNWDEQTAVTQPGGETPGAPSVRPPSTPGMKLPSTFVVSIRPKNPKGPATRLSFGRSSICDVVLPFSAVSKHHGYFERSATGWLAIDAGSKNGTVVDGKAVTQSKPVPMNDGATLQLGKLSARFFTAQGFVAVLKQRLAI